MSHAKIQSAFTIVELLVVIVVIGILAAITTVSYTNISSRAIIATLQSDLINSSKKLAIYYTEYGSYPTAMASTDSNITLCPVSPNVDNDYCLKGSGGNVLAYSTNPTDGFVLLATKNNNTYSITKNTSPLAWATIGNQTWSSKNLNVGTMIAGVTNQTNNGIIEKYCYNNDESNCTTYGAFYQWNEAMNWSATEKAQGICPSGSHIPSDAEWKTLEMSLSGMSQAIADGTGWRGVDEGTKLRIGGGSGLNMPFAGYRFTNGSYYDIGSTVYSWSSSESASSAWFRIFSSAQAGVSRNLDSKVFGFSIRCLKD